jgi:hypothetical protein
LVNAFQLPNRRKFKHFNLKFHNYNVNNWWLINNLATNQEKSLGESKIVDNYAQFPVKDQKYT